MILSPLGPSLISTGLLPRSIAMVSPPEDTTTSSGLRRFKGVHGAAAAGLRGDVNGRGGLYRALAGSHHSLENWLTRRGRFCLDLSCRLDRRTPGLLARLIDGRSRTEASKMCAMSTINRGDLDIMKESSRRQIEPSSYE
jgi:hypothetical protein